MPYAEGAHGPDSEENLFHGLTFRDVEQRALVVVSAIDPESGGFIDADLGVLVSFSEDSVCIRTNARDEATGGLITLQYNLSDEVRVRRAPDGFTCGKQPARRSGEERHRHFFPEE